MWFLLFGLLLAADANMLEGENYESFNEGTDANMVELKTYEPINEGSSHVLSVQFHETLLRILATERNVMELMVEALKEELPICMKKLNDASPACETCARAECSSIVDEAGMTLPKFDVGFMDMTLWDEMKDFFNGVGSGFVFWSGWDDMGDWFDNLPDGVTEWTSWDNSGYFLDFSNKPYARGFWSNVKNGFKKATKKVTNSAKKVTNGVKSGFKKVEDHLKKKGPSFVKSIKSGRKSIFNGYLKIGKGTAKLFGFGRKKRSSDFLDMLRLRFPGPIVHSRPLVLRKPVFPRRPIGVVPRTINPEERECMSRCGDCAMFLMPYEDMIIDVCGEEVAELNYTVRMVEPKIEFLYNRMIVEKMPVYISFEYDPTSLVLTPEVAYKRAYITAYFEDGNDRFTSMVPYYVQNLPKTAALMAKQFWETHMARS